MIIVRGDNRTDVDGNDGRMAAMTLMLLLLLLIDRCDENDEYIIFVTNTRNNVVNRDQQTVTKIKTTTPNHLTIQAGN